jgi:hypothetical protein
LRVHPFGAIDYCDSAPAFICPETKRILDVSDLADRDSGVIGAAFDPEQIRVVTDMAVGGASLSLPVERD